MPTYQDLGYAAPFAVGRDRARAVFGQTMGLVALTFACSALGAYITRHTSGGGGLFMFLGVFACIFGLQAAAARGREQLAIGLLFGMGLLLGMAIGPVVNFYAHTQPSVVWEAAGATGGFVGALGAYGYATRRDLSHWGRALMWSLLGLIVVGLVLMFVSIPHANVVWSVVGLAVFGAFTIFDFNRLRRAPNMASAPVIAASIFLDVFNVFLLMLSLFGGNGSRRN